ncbi:MAG: hypothetical protein IIV26_04595 [Peptococcaceae bacterium]|nr:hypothetical protein [Peptococcaceae bacterium]
MSSYTTNLQLYKADPETDQNDTFNINTMLNDNWDKLDQKFGNVATATELNEVKKSVSDGKKNVANAITSMGVTTATDAEFQTMATNIKKIDTLSSVPHQGAEGTLNGYKYFNSNKTLSISTTEGEKVGLPDNVSGINEWPLPKSIPMLPHGDAVCSPLIPYVLFDPVGGQPLNM